MYKKFSNKYHKQAKLGITLKTYLMSIKNFSSYYKVMGSDFLCPELKFFFGKNTSPIGLY